ncbi:DUF6653 family protein [uncultured Roseibium sp.]|uniref:DUF6653 family protein n=1 Tax=uncultured Roseibium sp. TaxID=1936171 RepID=UPI003216EE9F
MPRPRHYQAMPAGQIRALGMSPKVWNRHASPLSVYSRMATLPLLLLAIWSHVWIGAGLAALATGLVVVWLWLNPRLFSPPSYLGSWAAKATLGERIWLNRMLVPIPQEDAQKALLLSVVAGVGFLVAVLGAVETHLLLTLSGMIVTYAGKLVFLDRMVALYERMHDAHPLYRFWTSVPDNDNRQRRENTCSLQR